MLTCLIGLNEVTEIYTPRGVWTYQFWKRADDGSFQGNLWFGSARSQWAGANEFGYEPQHVVFKGAWLTELFGFSKYL